MIDANLTIPMAIPNRVFKGIFEILGYVKELLQENREKSEDNENERDIELADIPDRIYLESVSVKTKNVGFEYSFNNLSDLAASMPLYIQILKKNNEVIQGSIVGSMEMGYGGKIIKQAFSIFVDLFRDVRRIEEFVTVKKIDEIEIKQTLIVGYLDNRDLVISILKEDKVIPKPTEPADPSPTVPEPEPPDSGA